MNDGRKLFERHAAWQKERAKLPWPEKIRLAESLRETLLKFRSLRAQLSAVQIKRMIR